MYEHHCSLESSGEGLPSSSELVLLTAREEALDFVVLPLEVVAGVLEWNFDHPS